MNLKQHALIAVASAIVLLAPASADQGHMHHHAQMDHHHGASFAAGKPGTPSQSSRVIEITMNEADGKMIFSPARIEVKRGEQVTFVLRNSGELDHEFVLGTTAENLKHAAMMMTMPDMRHDDANGKQLAAKATAEMAWTFSKPGEFEYACLIPGHREAGMLGTVVVR